MEEQKLEPKKEEAIPSLEAVQKATAELKIENDRKEALLKLQEQMLNRQAMSGKSEAGASIDPKVQAKEEHIKRWEGSGMNPFKGAGAKALD